MDDHVYAYKDSDGDVFHVASADDYAREDHPGVVAYVDATGLGVYLTLPALVELRDALNQMIEEESEKTDG